MIYKTISKLSVGEYSEKHSRFICSVTPTTTEEEAVLFINKIKSENRTARHNAYAYILRASNRARYSDDGEPKSTAGLPMLDILEKNNLTDITAVVTRYFGGILLGTGGLVRAYSEAVKIALSEAEIVNMTFCQRCKLHISYSFFEKAEKILSAVGAVTDECVYSDSVDIYFHIQEEKVENLTQTLNDNFSASFEISSLGCEFLPMPV